VADAVVQPVRMISSALAAQSRAMRKAMVMQRGAPARRAPLRFIPPPFPRRGRDLL
jgi:hypothetical protein